MIAPILAAALWLQDINKPNEIKDKYGKMVNDVITAAEKRTEGGQLEKFRKDCIRIVPWINTPLQNFHNAVKFSKDIKNGN